LDCILVKKKCHHCLCVQAAKVATYAADEAADLANTAQGAIPEPFFQPIQEPSLWERFLSLLPDLIIFFIIGVALGIGIFFLIRFFKRKQATRKIRIKR
ncbi:hypothetical protein ACFL0V_03510, partial [Nanoarchaeota archaeon]